MSVGASAHESAVGHVTGTATYVDDIPLPAGALHLATGYADEVCGVIERIDLEEVRRAPGVVDVFTANDIPGNLDVGAVYPGDPLLANGEVRFHGQPVFAVVATSLRAAKQAARLARIDVSDQTPRLTSSDAIASDDFVLPSRTWVLGDTSSAAGEHRIESNLRIRGQEHFYLEGQAAIAIPEEDDNLRVYSSTQHPDEVQHLTAGVLDIDMHKVRVICRRMGGAFGGKESQAAPLACLAAVAARRNNRAVSYRMPRQDDFIQTGKRHDFDASVALSCDAAGVLTSATIELAGLCGHSPDLSEGIVDRAMFHAMNAYFAPNLSITGHRCRTNTVSHTAFRGFGGPQGMLACEAAMDELAFTSGIDPLQLRLRNLYRPDANTTAYGQQVDQFILADLMQELAERCDYQQRRQTIRDTNDRATNVYRGLALTPVQFGISFTVTHLNQAGALLNVFHDGSVEINHAGTEMGQGLFTKVRQVAARALGLPLHRLTLGATQTDKVPNGSPTAASSGSDINGLAVLDACDKLITRLRVHLRDDLGWRAGEIVFANDSVSDGAASMTWPELIRSAYLHRVPLSATGFYKTPDVHFDKEAGTGEPFYYYAFGAAASEVEINASTGEYRLLRTDILHDVGDSLNAAVDIGQIEGGFMQGLGWLTTEELLWDKDGRLASNSPATYKIPTADNCPAQLNVALYNAPNPKPTIFRSKAVGEPPLMLAISAWCALRDAACAAGGYQHLPALAAPATPEAVLWAVRDAKGGGQR